MEFVGITQLIWDLEEDPEGNIQHILDHGVTTEEVEDVLFNSANPAEFNPANGTMNTEGFTATGRLILVAWIWADQEAGIAQPITAYGPNEEG